MDQIAILQKEMSLQSESHEQALQQLEAEITELKVVVNSLPARLDDSEADIACAASEAAELRAAVLLLKGRGTHQSRFPDHRTISSPV
jgi:septal ring factor EnvC (AmiA/AmiB activator)